MSFSSKPVRPTLKRGAHKSPAHINNVGLPSKNDNSNSHPRRSRSKVSHSIAEQGIIKNSRKFRLLVTLFVLVSLCLACVAGIFMFYKTTDKNLSLSESNASDALVSYSLDEPFYALCTADFTPYFKAASRSSDFSIMLVRIDLNSKTLSFIGIPSDLQLKFSDGNTYAVSNYPKELGDAGLILAISNFAEVKISAFTKTNASHIISLVEYFGPLNIDIQYEIDDPSVGYIVLDPGYQQIDSQSTMTLLRATNVANGFKTTSQNRVDFTVALLKNVLASKGVDLANATAEASKFVETNLTTSELLSIGKELQGFDDMHIYQSVVPCIEKTSVDDGSKILACNTSEWNIIKSLFIDGQDMSGKLSAELTEALRNCTVEVRNGASVVGAASTLADKLSSLGYSVSAVGNTYEGIVYPDTLVIYTDSEKENSARMVLSDLPRGRLVNGGDYYSTDADVLVIIGADWTL